MGSESSNSRLQIPAEAKKMVQTLKEIVNGKCTDSEIYAVLRDCNMNPDDAVQRLLTQDTFHEVKSKRERRKEMKETQESKAQGNNNCYYHGVKVGSEYVGCIQSQTSYNDVAKATHKGENELVASTVPSASLTHHMRTTNEQPSPHSENTDNRRQTAGTGDTICSSAQPCAVTETAWSGGTAGHVSMADIVRIGRPQNSSQIPREISYSTQDLDSQNLSHSCVKTPDDSLSQPPLDHDLQCLIPHASKTITESGFTASHHGFNDKWPLIEQQSTASGSSVLNASAAPSIEMFPNQSCLDGKETKMPKDCQSEVQVPERDAASMNPGSSSTESIFPSSKQKNVNAVGGASNGSEGMGTSSHLRFADGATPINDEVSLASINFQQLTLGKESTVTPSVDKHGVVFPNYMQALAADCTHLSFGTYKSDIHSTISGPQASSPSKIYLEEASLTDDSSVLCLEARNSRSFGKYLCDKQLGSMSGTHQLTANAGNIDMPVSLQPELIRQKSQNIPEVSGKHYTHQSSVSDSNFKKIQGLNSPLSVVITPNARNLPPYHQELQAIAAPIPIDMLASTVQVRDLDRAHSSFLGRQSVPLRYSNVVSSVGNQTIPISETCNPSAFSLRASYSSTRPGASLATQSVLPQPMSVHSYPEPTISLEEMVNFSGYHAIPPSYACNPASMQPGFPDNSVFHDSPAGTQYSLPQYRGGASMSSLPSSDPNTTIYGGFGSRTNFPQHYLHDLSTTSTPTGSSVGYDILHSRYQERNNFTTLQQNESPSIRTLSTGPDNNYFSLLEQSQQPSRYHQGQHLSQDYAALLHASAYHSEAGMTPDLQQQALGGMTFSRSQGPSSKQLHQRWP